MTPVAIGDIQRTQGTLKTVCKAKNRYRHLLLCLQELFKKMMATQRSFYRTEITRDLFVAGSLEAAYSLNWGVREIWGKGGGETLALL